MENNCVIRDKLALNAYGAPAADAALTGNDACNQHGKALRELEHLMIAMACGKLRQ